MSRDQTSSFELLSRLTALRTGVVMLAGPAHSGKSELVTKLSPSPRATTLIGTMENDDPTISKRLSALRAARPHHWHTLEEPLALTDVLTSKREAATEEHIIIDAMNHWYAQLLLRDSQNHPIDEIEARLDHEFSLFISEVALQAQTRLITVVTAEVGASLAPSVPLGRLYRQQLGKYNQQLASAADVVLLVQFGLVQCIKGDA